MNQVTKLFTEVGPLLIFFLVYKFTGIDESAALINATISIVISTAVTLAITLIYEKRVAIIPLITAILITIFGGLTIFTKDTTFIKMKPTIINLVFAIIIFVSAWRGTGILKLIFGSNIELIEEHWIIFSKRWGYFFIIMAIANEIVWRLWSQAAWVNFKVFGIMGVTILFLFSQLPYLAKNRLDHNDEALEPAVPQPNTPQARNKKISETNGPK